MLSVECKHFDTDTQSSIFSWPSDQSNDLTQYENPVLVYSRKCQQPQRTANKLKRRRLGELSPNTVAPRLQDMEQTGGWEPPATRATRSKTRAEAGGGSIDPQNMDPNLHTPVHSRRGSSTCLISTVHLYDLASGPFNVVVAPESCICPGLPWQGETG